MIDKLEAIARERQEKCDHGITFDEEAACKILQDAEAARPKPTSQEEAAVAFIMGNPGAGNVRRRWPRGWFTKKKPCPKCGYVGIAYASYMHYILGDW